MLTRTAKPQSGHSINPTTFPSCCLLPTSLWPVLILPCTFPLLVPYISSPPTACHAAGFTGSWPGVNGQWEPSPQGGSFPTASSCLAGDGSEESGPLGPAGCGVVFALHFHSRDAVLKAAALHSSWQAPEGI